VCPVALVDTKGWRRTPSMRVERRDNPHPPRAGGKASYPLTKTRCWLKNQLGTTIQKVGHGFAKENELVPWTPYGTCMLAFDAGCGGNVPRKLGSSGTKSLSGSAPAGVNGEVGLSVTMSSQPLAAFRTYTTKRARSPIPGTVTPNRS